MAPTVIRILAAPEYFEAWRVVQIVGLGMCFYSFHQFFITGAFIKNKTWFLPISYTLSAGINIALNWYFLPKYGYFAAAWNTVLTYLVFSTIGFLLFRKIYPIPFEFRRLAGLLGLGIGLVILNNMVLLQHNVLEGVKELLLAGLFPLFLLFGPYLAQDEKESLCEELHKIHPSLARIYRKVGTRWTKREK
jgi:O-antigen/teichoic acid export membrane protein